ncbi:MAG: 30S ribosomal protein S3 [Candidatus Baldrarchaeia archaeon]
MPLRNQIIQEKLKKVAIDEFLEKELKRAGYAGVEIMKTPLGTRVIIYAERTGMVIGKRGKTVRELTQILREQFGIDNPQIEVVPVDNPDLNAKIIAARIASALQRGVHFRRAAYAAIRRAMEAGARGIEIVIGGKLVSERAKHVKFRAGSIPKSGEPAYKYVDEAMMEVLLKPGVYGIKVKIMRGDAPKIDEISIKEVLKEVESEKDEESGASG